MKIKITHYIYIFILLFSSKGFIAQNLLLKIASKNKSEIFILDKIDYKKKHIDSISIYREINQFSDLLKNNGYFTNTLDSVRNNKKKYIAYFSLNDKVEKAIIKINTESEFLFRNLKKINSTISIPLKKLQLILSNISKDLDKEGKSFSKVQLRNITIKNKTLFADLNIYQSKKRVIDRVFIKGYKNFPKSYLKNYLNIKPNTLFNEHKIKEISYSSKGLKFIKEIKPPEVLFTKDSTLLYLYLKKIQNNSFDGIINFASKENGDILFNGNIDLKLINTLNTGEKFELFWNSIGEERQEFKISTHISYLFSSKFSPELSFSIYKQDSTFLNTKIDSKLFYNINSKIKLALTYNSESSKDLKQKINNNIETFENYFLGLQFQYSIPKNDFFLNNKFFFEINPTFGKRKNNQNSINQFKIETSVSVIWNLNLRNSLFIKNTFGYLNSDTFIDNELFRIGGANSIRGYNEQSIFTSNYTYFNFEYRYLTSEKSYLYTITDTGIAKINSEISVFLGLGVGYLFNLKKSQIKLSSVVGKQANEKFNFNKSKIIINWKTFF